MIAGRAYANALSVEYWVTSYGGSPVYSSNKLVQTVIAGRNFSLSADKTVLDGTINAIAQYTDGETTPDFVLTGVRLSAVDYAREQALSDQMAFRLIFKGNDRVVLSPGNDRIDTWDGNDVIFAGGGDDTVYAGAGDDIVQSNAGNDWLLGQAGNDSLFGGSGNDILTGGTGTDLINGGSGRDTYSLDDLYTGSFTVDLRITGPQAIGTAGQATLVSIESLAGSYGKDTLIGDDKANWLAGNGDNDILFGNGGNDWLSADGGNDSLTGGSGADRFSLTELGGIEITRDRITDFNRAEGDRIVLSNYAVTGTFSPKPQALSFANFYSAPGAKAAQDASDRIIYNSSTGVLYYDPDGVGGKAAVAVADIAIAGGNFPDLSISDFLLI
ncbi:calcium-binding protein [Novosphingobium sp.]|uniref:calcium-binding protein n=1 Tax=Novosphingobium sp. TaxID=1874826 RepID=UPI0026345D60|nr:calcium-binding protein [Novosphingobium sp.]